MDLAGGIISSCYRSLSSGIKQTMILIGARIMACRYLLKLRDRGIFEQNAVTLL